ncbi:MAG: NapC/NirT family cytochrome c [Dethiobacter sp.]|jgi:nitrate/TMAO reductase-like tetraheme cytochrome c subunit|nr:NapC/NirT family cytochrome c [Dethiobacter sp.]
MQRLKIFKGLSHGARRGLYAAGAVFACIIFIFLLTLAADARKPEFCANCHLIQPYYYTWENSPHSKVNCLECHVEQGTGFVAIQARGLKNLSVYRAGDVDPPITGTKKISSDVCLRCHSPNRKITPSKDLSIPHSEHLGYGTDCVDCHVGVSHGGISEMDKFSVDETVLAGFKNTDYNDFALTKTRCLECHNGMKATYNCQACHTETRIPSNHSQTATVQETNVCDFQSKTPCR